MEDRATALLAIVEGMHPMTVRQVFYQATVHGFVDKTEAGYSKVQRLLVDLRRAGRLPFAWIADNTRWQRKPRSFNGWADALRLTAQTYRRALWSESEVYVEVWLEKDALASIVMDVTEEFDVPLMVARGFASLTFLQSSGEAIAEDGRPAHVYHLGDFDPSGVAAAEAVERELRRYAGAAPVHFHRLAVQPEQIERWRLPTRPTKASDSRAKGFGAVSVELDAIDPHRLRLLVREAIERHMPRARLDVLLAAEEAERAVLVELAQAGEAWP